jgi:glycosyltransferase involved in cell wall biosynthesis
MIAMPDVLYIVVPCYNEEEALPETVRQLTAKLTELIEENRLSPASRVLFVNDGSKDRTWALIKAFAAKERLVSGLNLSRNEGHQNALLAGLIYAKERADMVISMDADLQDDIAAVDEMVGKYLDGCDIVYGVRNSRKTDSFFKRFTAEAFYRLMSALGASTVFNPADYRLLSKRALEGLSRYKEVNLFLRGIVPLIGYRTDTVFYERRERLAGESKYPFKKMLAFALEGVTSFSVRPIRMITALGVIIFIISFFMLLYVLISFFSGSAVSGWPSILVSVWALGGLTLLSIGVVGEYIGKIYMESKARPRFIVEETIERDGDALK